MTYCVTPECQHSQNSEGDEFCRRCGSQLLLKERYRAVRPIGQGGFGRTFLAVDEHIPSRPSCVIKQLYYPEHTDTYKKVVSLFRQEAVRLDELGKHPQIPQLLAHFEQEQKLYLVQEFIQGQTLSDELKQKGTYNETKIWEMLRDLLPILEYIHNRHVLHRDIKPANIIRYERDASSQSARSHHQLVLIDFGIAKLFSDTAMCHTGTIIGSPQYIAPEQNKGKALPASDLYSLGVTCIYMLTGVPPLDMFDIIDNRWLWRRHLPSGTSVSDRLGKIIDKLLQNAISQRYQNAVDVLKSVNQTTTISYKPVNSNLGSEVGVDYKKLQNLLAARKWKEADEETWVVMCKVLGKHIGSYFFTSDINKFPCQDLWTIDQLWLKYSNRRFGFSVQKLIYDSVEGEYERLCDRVGWPTNNPHISESGLQFNNKAPLGHLPSHQWAGGYEWWHHASAMAARLEQCGITKE